MHNIRRPGSAGGGTQGYTLRVYSGHLVHLCSLPCFLSCKVQAELCLPLTPISTRPASTIFYTHIFIFYFASVYKPNTKVLFFHTHTPTNNNYGPWKLYKTSTAGGFLCTAQGLPVAPSTGLLAESQPCSSPVSRLFISLHAAFPLLLILRMSAPVSLLTTQAAMGPFHCVYPAPHPRTRSSSSYPGQHPSPPATVI